MLTITGISIYFGGYLFRQSHALVHRGFHPIINYCFQGHELYALPWDDSREAEIIKRQKVQEEQIQRQRRHLEYWGVETINSSNSNERNDSHEKDFAPTFPRTLDAVADEVFDAVSGTLFGMQCPDPNVVSNAMHKSVLDYRPTHPNWASSRSLSDSEHYADDELDKQRKLNMETSTARMGIEIDGAAYLLSSEPSQYNDEMKFSRHQSQVRASSTDEGRAMRALSLKVARRLTKLYDDKTNNMRSVAIYYNTLDQTLLASNEYRQLKQSKGDNSDLDLIQICCVGQHSLPENMKRSKSKDQNNGIILIVKPSDYDVDSLKSPNNVFHSSRNDALTEYHPTIHPDIINNLQSLFFQAAASSIPSVVMSPRLSELSLLQQYSTSYRYRTGPSGFEQSGFQRSAFFGGREPPVGPTSWLLRDLIPPIYVWVGCSLDLLSRGQVNGRKGNVLPSLRSLMATYHNEHSLDAVAITSTDDETYSFYSRVALKQSAMTPGHYYHMFVVKERTDAAEHSKTYSGDDSIGGVKWDSTYEYMGSTKASLGRPTVALMRDMFSLWRDNVSFRDLFF